MPRAKWRARKPAQWLAGDIEEAVRSSLLMSSSLVQEPLFTSDVTVFSRCLARDESYQLVITTMYQLLIAFLPRLPIVPRRMRLAHSLLACQLKVLRVPPFPWFPHHFQTLPASVSGGNPRYSRVLATAHDVLHSTSAASHDER